MMDVGVGVKKYPAVEEEDARYEDNCIIIVMDAIITTPCFLCDYYSFVWGLISSIHPFVRRFAYSLEVEQEGAPYAIRCRVFNRYRNRIPPPSPSSSRTIAFTYFLLLVCCCFFPSLIGLLLKEKLYRRDETRRARCR